jgi:hypothetical protein
LTRRFRFRIRSGTFISASDDPGTPGFVAEPGTEIVLSEIEAAQLLRIGRRDVELLEVIEDDPTPRKPRLPG